jgi:RimJ/RimL family protein N-acetyltransferase
MSDPTYIDNIGDRGIKNLADAIRYLHEFLAKSGDDNALRVVEERESGRAIGLCGLLRRDFLEYQDLGYAFLPSDTGKGYAREAASAVLETVVSERTCAIVSQSNVRSKKLLEDVGFSFVKVIKFPATGEDVEYWERPRP